MEASEHTTEKYKLPTNKIEMDRLEVQHRMWKLLIGGLYPPSLNALMREKVLPVDKACFILDVGCGSGIWAIEMAKKFPHAQVMGFDLNEQSYHGAPDNFQFIQGDLSQQLPRGFQNKFSLVHCRCVTQHVPDPQVLIATLATSLEPAGLLLIGDGDWVAFDEQQQLLDPFIWDPAVDFNIQLDRNDISWYAGWLNAFGAITRSDKYENIDVMLQNSSVFKDIHYNKYFSPINWDGDGVENGEEIGKIMNKNMQDFFDGGVSVMISRGVPATLLESWRDKYTEELGQHRYNIWHFASAIRA